MVLSVLVLAGSHSVSTIINTALQKEATDFRSVGHFYNALDALSFSVSLKPQIVILEERCVDAFITWQQFIHDLCAKAPQTQFILLSERSDHPGAGNVLPVHVPDLTIDVLSKALFAARERYNTPNPPASKRYAHSSGSWFRSSQQFSELISNTSFIRSSRFDQSLIKVQNHSGWLLVGQTRSSKNQGFSFFQDPGQLDSLLRELASILTRSNGGNAFVTSDHQLCIWVTAATPNLQSSMGSLEKLCKQINRAVTAAGFPACGFQCSTTPVTPELLAQEYRAVSSLCTYRFFVDDETLLYSQWLTNRSVPMDFSVVDALIVQLQTAIGRLDHDLLHETFSQLLAVTTNTYSITSYHYVWCELVFLHNQQLQQHSALSEDLLPDFCYNDFSRIDDAFRTLETLFEKLLNFLSNKQSKYSNPYIHQVVEYVTARFTEELTLADAAGFVHVSVSYLSRLFKKEVGCSFTDFVNELRINRAKELLANSTYKIYEIAETVGFENTKYFSQVFKAYTGQSPKEYQLSSGDRTRKDGTV